MFLYNLFFRQKQTEVKEENKENIQIDNIKDKINIHENKIRELDIIINELKQKAKEKIKKGNKESAKRLLSKRKKYLGQIKLVKDAVSILENQKMLIENSIIKKDIVNTIKIGNSLIKDISKDLNVNEIEEIKDDMDKLKDDEDEINEILQINPEEIEELDNEVNQIEAEIINDELNKVFDCKNNKKELNTKEKLKREEENLLNFLDN
jgi:charged multivesicular body protein 6